MVAVLHPTSPHSEVPQSRHASPANQILPHLADLGPQVPPRPLDPYAHEAAYTCFCAGARTHRAGRASGSNDVRLGSLQRSAGGRDCGTENSAGSGTGSGTRSGSGSVRGGQSGSNLHPDESGRWSGSWSGSWRSSRQRRRKRRRRSGGCRQGTRAGQHQPGPRPPPGPGPPPRWQGCRAGGVSVTDRALALRPGAGPPGWGGAGSFPGAPDAAAAAAAAAASSSLPPKLVMNVIFSSRPGLGERERERDSELDSEGDLQGRGTLGHQAP